ncbi:MAG: hypothetical protein QM724_07440 [Flavobacteriales bacterium]
MAGARPPILIVCYTFPPSAGIGGRRWAKFAKAFARKGHPVHVICAEPPKNNKPSYWTNDAATLGITTHPLPRRYPMIVHRWPLINTIDRVRYHFWLHVLPLLTSGNSLDATVFWRKPLLRKANALIQVHGIRHVIISGAPFRLLVHGLALKEQHPDIMLLSDLRDPWTWWDNYGHGSLPRERFAQEQALERSVMMGSDLIATPHQPVIDHIQSSYPKTAGKCLLVPHAIDSDEVPVTPPPDRAEGFRLIYTGTLYGAAEAEDYIRALIEAFRVLEHQAPEQARRTTMTFLITANDERKYARMVEEAGMQERIRFEPPVEPKEVFARIADAHAALVFIPSKNSDLIGTKFQELFYMGRPVIHVGEPGAVSRAIEQDHLGISLRVAELALELPRIILGERPFPADPKFDRSAVDLTTSADHLLTHLGL